MNLNRWLLLIMIAFPTTLFAGMQNDPVLLKVNHRTIHLSEFESAYQKATNATEKKKKKKSEVNEFLNLYIHNQLKIAEAETKRMDTLTNIRSKLQSYQNKLTQNYNASQVKNESFSAYLREYKQKHNKEQRQIIQIYKKIPQITNSHSINKTSLQMDSIYRVLTRNSGRDFAAQVETHSDDKNTVWISRLETPKEFENVVFSLKEGEISTPFFTPQGIHIVKLLQKREQTPTEELEQTARQRWIRKNRLNADFKQSFRTRENLHQQQKTPIEQQLRTYRDQLLLVEINKKEIGEKLNDRTGLQAYFTTHTNDYKWDPVRYRGIVIHCKDKKLIRKAKRLVKGLPIDEWEGIINAYFNSSRNRTVLVEKNSQYLFIIGENQYVDKLVFKKPGNVLPPKGFPYAAVVGKKAKKPDSYQEVLDPLKADYKNFLESLWLNRLQANSKVEINEEVLKTVNNH